MYGRRRRRRLSGRFIILVAALVVGLLAYFIGTALAVDDYDENGHVADDGGEGYDGYEYATPSVPPDITLLQTSFNDAALLYILYYTNHTLDINRHIIIDNEGLVRFVTYSPRYNRLSINTSVPVVVRPVYESSTGNIYIHIINPRDVYDRIVVIDPGHGGLDVGVIIGEHSEADIVLEISLLLYGLFRQSDSGVRAFLTRDDDSWVFNAQRTHIANTIGDLLLSVHVNSFVYDTTVGGTETLYRPDGLMEELGNAGRMDITNAQFSQIAQDHLIAELGTRDRGIRQRFDILLLNTSLVPTAYVEIDFITNPAVLANLIDPAYQLGVAQALYRAVVETFMLGLELED